MYARPAGMSDEESDEEGFAFHDEFKSKRNNSYVREMPDNAIKRESLFYISSEDANDEKQNLEFRAFEACMSGSKDIIDEFLTSGRKVDEFLHTGWTLLLYAASAAQNLLVEYLLELGANPNLHKDGFTPLMALSNCPRGASENCLKCLHLLLEAKANVDATSKRRETALMFACKIRDSDFIREFVRHMKSVNAADSEGQTALFCAVKANRIEIVQILLEFNADIYVRDRFSLTPYDIAKTKGFEKIAELLDVEANNDAPVNDTMHLLEWKDMFPSTVKNHDDKLDFDIATILYGMGLDRYKQIFKGMNLKTFLKLTEEDLENLGMDISVHRKRFVEDLHKFHSKKWDLRSLGAIKKSLPFTIYDGVMTLGNAAKQISIVNSSFRFIKNSLMKGQNENLDLSPTQKVEYSNELQKSEDSLVKLEKELLLVKKLADKIDKETEIKVPATYLSEKKRSFNWTIALSITAMIGIFLSKTKYAQKLWND